MFSEKQITRYSRHILLPQVGGKGQKKILESSVLIIGAGGLGCPAALYLVAAGIGRIGLVDSDKVELSNLQRQILYSQETIGEDKVDAARRRLQQLNDTVTVESWACAFGEENGRELIKNYDIVLDGSDNFQTRYCVNKLCVQLNKPLISAAAQRFSGQLAHFDTSRQTGCYYCLYPQQGEGPAGNCSESGVLAPVVGVMGTLQATETLKTILGLNADRGKLLLWDGLEMSFTKLSLQRDPQCPVCGDKR